MQQQMIKNQRLFFSILGAVFLCAFVSNGFAQSLSPQTIGTRFEDYNRKNLREKIYVHTDKELYLAGEIIWFKVYNTDQSTNRPLELSKVAYVEIIDKNQKPVLQAKIALDRGSGSGSLNLPVELLSGNYQLRAYTNWMKNSGVDYFFEKNIAIVNTLVKPDGVQTLRQTDAVDIQFFAEGGQMVEGLPAKVAFRAIDSNGKGIDFKGSLLDENNNLILEFKPLKYGIGTFSFNPLRGQSYRARIELPDSKVLSKNLVLEKKGMVMHLENTTNNKIKVSIRSSNNEANQKLLFFAHTRQDIKFNEAAIMNNGQTEFLIDKARLGEGISHFTLFNDSGQPLAERLYFIRPQSRLQIDAKTDQQQYSTRKKVTIDLSTKENVDASISVYSNLDGEPAAADIFNYLWLKSDLKGNVESPEYYLNNYDATADEALDNLMLTHGWRRFVWEKVFSNDSTTVNYLPEIDGAIINGKISDTRTGAVAGNILSYLSVPGKKLHLYTSMSDSKGRVRFFTRDIFGPSEIVAQTNTQKDSTYRIEIDSPFFGQYSNIKRSDLYMDEGVRKQLLKQSLGVQVQNVFASDKLNTFYPALVDSAAFYLKPDKRYLLDDFVRFNTMEEVLREYVAEVPLTRQRDDFSIWVIVRPHLTDVPKNVKPLIILDGVPVFDSANKIIKYDPKKVQSIDVVSQKYFLGPVSFESILNFTTYKGNLPDFQLDRRATILDYEGLQLKREFYSPEYETVNQNLKRMPDFRNVLYWSPDIRIDSKGKKTISFYTSDKESTYTVVVQGLSAAGNAGSTSFNIQVKK